MATVRLGTRGHPETACIPAELVAIEWPRGESGESWWGPEILPDEEEPSVIDGPFGYWARAVFRTSEGAVATLLSCEYAPGSPLHTLACWRYGEHPPEELETDNLVGTRLYIRVERRPEHGALVPVANVLPYGKERF